MKYNEVYASLCAPEYYMSILRDYSFLTRLIMNHLYRNQGDHYRAYDDMVLESLEHFMLKTIYYNPTFKRTLEYDNFIKMLIAMINGDYSESYTNAFINNCNLVTDIKPYVSKTDYQHLLQSRRLTKSTIDRITTKMDKQQKVLESDLDTISDIHYRLRDYDSFEYETLIRYLFGPQLTDKGNITLAEPEINAILSFLPSIYRVDNHAMNFDIRSVRCALSNDNIDGSKINTIATSQGLELCLFDREFYKNPNFKSTKSSKKIYQNEVVDLPSILMVGFHEITHNVQVYKAINGILDNQGLNREVNSLINKYEPDYQHFHDEDWIEIDAEANAFLQTRLFIDKYYSGSKKDSIIKQLIKNEKGTKTRATFAEKIDPYGRIEPAMEHDINRVNELLLKHPEELHTYPLLQIFYRPDGVLDFYRFIFIKDINNLTFGSEALKQFISNINSNELYNHLINRVRSTDEITNLVNNIYGLFKEALNSIRNMDYYKQNKLNGDFSSNDSDEHFEQISHRILYDTIIMFKQGIKLLMTIRSIPYYSNLTNMIDYTCYSIEDLIKDIISETNISLEHKETVLNHTKEDYYVLNDGLLKVQAARSYIPDIGNKSLEEQERIYKAKLVEARRNNILPLVILYKNRLNSIQMSLNK